MLSAVSLFSRFGSFFFVLTSDFQFIDGVESINITSLSREHVTHALYICYMTMSCICLSLIKFMLCYAMLITLVARVIHRPT